MVCTVGQEELYPLNNPDLSPPCTLPKSDWLKEATRSPFLLELSLPSGNPHSSLLPNTRSGPNMGITGNVGRSVCPIHYFEIHSGPTPKSCHALHHQPLPMQRFLSVPRWLSAQVRRDTLFIGPLPISTKDIVPCRAGMENGRSPAKGGPQRVRPVIGAQQKSITLSGQ